MTPDGKAAITTWQQPDDLWAYRLEAPCSVRGCIDGYEYRVASAELSGQMMPYGPCETCNGTGTVAYSQHGYRTRRLALVRAKQVIHERSLEPRRYEETVEVEGT